MKKRLTLACLVLAFWAKAQDPIFMQTYSAPAYANPAFIAADTVGRFSTAARIQWPELPGSYNTFYAGYNMYLAKLNGFAGAQLVQDNAGPMGETRIMLNYAHQFRIGKSLVFCPALEAGFFSRRLDWSKLTFGDMIDPRRGFVLQTSETPTSGTKNGVDVSAGAMVYYKYLYLGFSAHHITQPDVSMLESGTSPLSMRYGIQTGYTLNITLHKSFTMDIIPYGRYNWQGPFSVWAGGLNLRVKNIIIGGGVIEEGYMANAGYVNRLFQIVYSYDYMNGINSGSHELSLAVFFWKRPAHKNYVPVYLSR